MNSVLLSAFQYAASKKSVLTDPNFFSPKNHNSIQVHMVDELFLSINLVLTACDVEFIICRIFCAHISYVLLVYVSIDFVK